MGQHRQEFILPAIRCAQGGFGQFSLKEMLAKGVLTLAIPEGRPDGAQKRRHLHRPRKQRHVADGL